MKDHHFKDCFSAVKYVVSDDRLYCTDNCIRCYNVNIGTCFSFSETPEIHVEIHSETFNVTEILSDNIRCAMSGLDDIDPEESCTTVSTCDTIVSVNCGKYCLLF